MGVKQKRRICNNMNINIHIHKTLFTQEELYNRSEQLTKWHELIMSSDSKHIGANFKGWAKLPDNTNEDLISKIEHTAEYIKSKCSLFVVIGIGGSFLGSKAVIEALNGSKDDWPEVAFAGFNMNGAYINKIKKRMENESVCLCVISKSGRTVEPLLSYAVLKDLMFSKYGIQEARKRIFIITDETKGELRPEAFENQFESFIIPNDIGGRYSVLTTVGLLPIAVSGHNIRALLLGASEIQHSDWSEYGDLINYASSRTLLQEKGKWIEIFEYFEGNLECFGEWLKQLFGETEGKCGKGVFPASLFFSRDLHSIGQFLQEGRQVFFETIVKVKNSTDDVEIPWYAGFPYAGKMMETINRCAEGGVIRAHINAKVPINEISVTTLNEHVMGELIYFFEMSAAISAYALGLNPFNQPGVEEYKKEMQALISEIK